MKAILEGIDKELMESRNTEVYRYRGKKRTCIKTLMGPVEFERVIYECKNEEGKKSFVFLLYQHLKIGNTLRIYVL